MATQPEARFKTKVLAYLKLLPNTWAVKIQQTSINGTPDILCCISGFFVALELKKDAKSKTTPLQDYNLEKIDGAGGHAFTVSPESWEGCQLFLSRLSRLRNHRRRKQS